MELVFLGHASWLSLVGELRILFDPLLAGPHHGGVFEVYPARRIHERALEADFIVVSHRHPDHFDVQSLARLAELDADSVVLTSDTLVERTARALGFRSVRRLETFDRVELEDGELLTTPSHGTEIEWGMLVRRRSVTVWNQVDSVAGGPERVREMLEQSARAFGIGEPRLAIDLGLVRFQPLLEIQAQIGEPTGFPLRAYRELLDEVAELGAAAIVPASAGSRHADRFAHMNRIAYPVTEARFLRDVSRRVPVTHALPARVGGRYRVFAGGAEDCGEARDLVEPIAAHDDRLFRPFELPPIVDPLGEPRRESADFIAIDRWVREELGPALARAYPGMRSDRTLSFTLEVIGPTETRAWTLRVDERGARVSDDFDADYDALVAIAASELALVIGGTKSWAEPLLAGLLRASTRAYHVDESGLRRLSVGIPFLYYALSYEQSVENAVRALISACDRNRAAPRS